MIVNGEVLIIASSISVIVTLAILLYNLLLTKKIEKRYSEKLNKVVLDVQREEIESEQYKLSESMTATFEKYDDVNNLLFYPQNKQVYLSHSVNNLSFYKDLGIDFSKYTVQEGSIAVLMPFHKSFDKLYSAIRRACDRAGFICHRSDEQFLSSNILKYTVEMIIQSQLVVAVIDGRNPNVFYEIGLTYSIGKPVILLSNIKEKGNIPFNVQSNQTVWYNNTSDLDTELYTRLVDIKQSENSK